MKAKVNLGKNIQIEIEDSKEMEVLHKAIVLGNPKEYCAECQATEGFYFTSNKDTEGNVYVNYKCKCGARSKLGQYKTGGYFWKEFEKYIPKGETNEN